MWHAIPVHTHKPLSTATSQHRPWQRHQDRSGEAVFPALLEGVAGHVADVSGLQILTMETTACPLNPELWEECSQQNLSPGDHSRVHVSWFR